MKKRKLAIVSFLISAILLLGVGFAALSDTLTFKGNVTITEDEANKVLDQKVYIAGVYDGEEVVSDITDEVTHGYTASVNVAQDEASFHVYELKTKGQKKTIKFQIKNEFDRDVNIVLTDSENNPLTMTKTDEYGIFKITYSFAQGVSKITAGESIDITATVEVLMTPARDISFNFDFSFDVEVLAQDEVTLQ